MKKTQVKYNFYMLMESMKRTNVYTSFANRCNKQKHYCIHVYLQCTSPIYCSKVDVMK